MRWILRWFSTEAMRKEIDRRDMEWIIRFAQESDLPDPCDIASDEEAEPAKGRE